ncbi:hypothetical protein VC940_22780 [Citrobacter freundii]|nr:hypothetical protein [Citrobacter freundii]
MTVHTIKQCRPSQKETEYFWKLFHAAQRNDARWHGSEISIIADELSRTDLDRNQKQFLLRAWQVLIDDKGGFGRFMGAFDTYVYNMQDPADDCVAWKPELSKLLCDGQLLDVVIEAYQSARQRIVELETGQLTTASRDVLAERQRQISMEGWKLEHDDEHCNGELAMAAVCYINETGTVNRNGGKPWGWPWDASWWKPKNRRRNLVKAGALILAEIERLDRDAGIGVKGE